MLRGDFLQNALPHAVAPLILYCSVLATKLSAFSKSEAYADANFSDPLINLASGNLLIRATRLLQRSQWLTLFSKTFHFVKQLVTDCVTQRKKLKFVTDCSPSSHPVIQQCTWKSLVRSATQ